MVARGISSYGLSKLIFFVGNCNSECYEDCLKFYKEDITRLKRQGNINTLYFQHDRARPHTSDYTAEKMSEIFDDNEVLPVEWCPKGADFSPVELLWNIIEMQLKKNSYSNLHELKYAIQDIWNRIPLDLCQNLMKTFDTRIRVVNKLKGAKYTSKIESEIIRKKLKRRKKLRKSDFEIKPTYDYSNYWHYHNDNIERVIINESYLIEFLEKYQKKMIRKKKITNQTIQMNQKKMIKDQKNIEKDRFAMQKRNDNNKMSKMPFLNNMMNNLTKEKIKEKEKGLSIYENLISSFRNDLEIISNEIDIHQNMTVKEFRTKLTPSLTGKLQTLRNYTHYGNFF